MQEARTLDLRLSGLTCAGCVGRVEAALRSVAGVAGASVNLATGHARVEGGDPAGLVAAVRRAGYDAAEDTITLDVSGMHCGGCVRRVEQALDGLPGVLSSFVNLLSHRAEVRVLAGTTGADALAEQVTRAGFKAHARKQAEADPVRSSEQAREAVQLRRDALSAVAATLPLVAIGMGGHIIPGLRHWLHPLLTSSLWGWASLILASYVLFGPGIRFFRLGTAAFGRRAPDMNSLVALGSGAAWLTSLLALLGRAGSGHDLWFESAAVIVTLVLIGRWLEADARGRAGDAIRGLLDMQPATARRVSEDELVEVSVSALAVGDVVAIRPGERIPVDGSVTEGRSAVDEALVSGESVAIEKQAGDLVTSGTINGTGSLRVRVTATGEQAFLGRMVRMVEQAQAAKLPIQALVDRVTIWFVPTILLIGLVTLVAWRWGVGSDWSIALTHAVAVLIVACPCAMGLATPAAIIVGTGRAARLGLLFRRGDALQALSRVRLVAFDKTGTLTEGRPNLAGVRLAGNLDEKDLLRLAGAVERDSEHPFARALVAAAKERTISLPVAERFEAIPGQGARAIVDGRSICVGSARYMDTLGIAMAGFKMLQPANDRGASLVYIAIDGRPAAVLELADTVRPTAAEAIGRLRTRGITVVLLTGDRTATAHAIARDLHIEQVTAEARPEDKLTVLRKFEESGPIAFVGDGLNDAPALAAATVGIAIGAGTDIAIESADVVLVHSDPCDVATAVEISHATMTIIRQNLAWAFGYNLLLIPVAAGALGPFTGWTLSPMLAAAAMALSSVSVLANALRLRRFRPRSGNAPNAVVQPAVRQVARFLTSFTKGASCH